MVTEITILGEHISIIRPEKVQMPIIRRKDMPKASYNKRAKEVKEHCGKVKKCFLTKKRIKLILENGEIVWLDRKRLEV